MTKGLAMQGYAAVKKDAQMRYQSECWNDEQTSKSGYVQ